MSGAPYTHSEVAPLQTEIESYPQMATEAVPAQIINPQCIAATCGAFAMLGLAAGAASAATRQGSAPTQTPSMDETVGFDEETKKDKQDKKDKKPLKGKLIVLVATGAAYLKDHPTGVWLEELATPYYLFKAAGADVLVASPEGGPIPVDAASMGKGYFTDSAKMFMMDPDACNALFHSKKLAGIDLAEVDALYFAGGHGACVDFGKDSVTNAIETMYNDDKIVAFDCHGPVALYACKGEDGEPLVKGKDVTGFSNSEEKGVKMTKLVPVTPEAQLKKLGANYSKGDDWTSHAVQDGNLITGQNPKSSKAVAVLVIKALI